MARLLRTMGVETLSPTPRRSQPHPERRVYPDVLRGVPMTRVNPVWSTDIPSIRLQAGCVSLVAVMEWFRRDVLSWAVSMTMAGGCCLEAWEQALGGATPALVTSAQGALVTRADCTRRLEAAGVHIRMAGRGRALDHGFVERLWRTVNDEEVYVKDDRTPREARHG